MLYILPERRIIRTMENGYKENEMNKKELAYFAYESAVLAGDMELAKKLYAEYIRVCYTPDSNSREY